MDISIKYLLKLEDAPVWYNVHTKAAWWKVLKIALLKVTGREGCEILIYSQFLCKGLNGYFISIELSVK